ncbi:ribbon-helix-helix protein, CopG family [Desulfopila sp. IMCC35006]|uniref:ribbon-helix-helix protein, CopG family n=1 Tax=Desulfopila sp. IMCC35006 TaxID=2569542 RepID=UPI0010ACFE5D|nr:ribbon-helix-helix protein, CopG family [Desulfopila sp. IMCC35006]TKB28279.1 ribbon-helix-helix protein, CopG family [Desulfopila sp. IMCC35006]
MTKEKKKSTSLRLDPKVLKELKLLAIEQDTSIQAIVESLVIEYIKQYKVKS